MIADELRIRAPLTLGGFAREALRGMIPLGSTPSVTVYREHPIRLRRYGPPPSKSNGPGVFIIPSLINRHYVLDLLPGKSFIEYLVSQGLSVYLAEWEDAEDEDRWLGIDRMIEGHLKRAIDLVTVECGTSPILIGHCLGGTLAVLFSLRYPRLVDRLILLTAPVDFTDGGTLGTWCQHKSFDLENFIDAYRNAPWSFMQSAFLMMKPASMIAKYARLFESASNASFLKSFIALEIWSYDNVSLFGGCYEALIRDLYRDNRLARGTMTVSGLPIRLPDLELPVFNVAALDDHIVPESMTLREGENVTHCSMAGGHVGAVIGGRAQKDLWPRIVEWIR